MKVFSLLFVFFSLPVLASPQCGTPKRVSLFDRGQPLHNSTVTDQDGMLTCGSNTLSHMIKSGLRTEQDLSYMDIALQVAKGNWGTQKNPTKAFMIEKNRMAFEGMDNLCESLERLKSTGGVCPRNKFSFENTVYTRWGGNDNGERQMELMLTLSRFLDVQNNFHTFTTPDAKRKELQKILKYIEDKKLTFVDKCKAQGEGLDDVDFHETFQSLMGPLMLWISQNKQDPKLKSCVDLSIKYFNSFVETPYSDKDEHPLDIRSVIKKDFKKTYNHKSLFDQWKKGISPPPHEFSLPLAKYMDAQSLKHGLTKACNLGAADSTHPLSGAKLYQPTLTKSVLKDLNVALNAQECEKQKLSSWLKSNQAAKEIEPICTGFSGTRELLGALSVLPLWGDDIMKVLPRLIPDGHAEIDQLSRVLAPDCAPNRINVSSLNCKEHNAFIRINRRPIEELRQEFRGVALKSLDKGIAVGLGICQDFLSGDSSKEIESCQASGTGYHAVTLTGYRCQNGVMEYEVTNSWGNHCPVEYGAKDKNIECSYDEKGWPTGRYWVKEEKLIRNVDKFYEVSP